MSTSLLISTPVSESLPPQFSRIRAIRYDGEPVELHLSTDNLPIGKGTFAIVYKTFIRNTQETVAIKEVPINRSHKNRELEILRELNHPNIIQLKYYFFKQQLNTNEILCLVMEIFPETAFSLIKRWHTESIIDSNQVKLFTFQMFRALAYLHARDIAHRDIKPSNLLVNDQEGRLKVCDFGTAKHLLPKDPSVSYICSRYYRAPELIVGCTSYTPIIDMWSAACVVTEFYSGVPLFKGLDQNDQFLHIMLLLGEPNPDEIRDMMPKSDAIIRQQIQRKIALGYTKSRTLTEHLTRMTNSDFDCVQFCLRMLHYSPRHRLSALSALSERYYDEIRRRQTWNYVLEFDQTELDLHHLTRDSTIFKSIVHNFETKEIQQV